jgi:hypothetical protein
MVHDVGEANGQSLSGHGTARGHYVGAHMGEKALEVNAALAIGAQIAAGVGGQPMPRASSIAISSQPNVMISGVVTIKVLDFSLGHGKPPVSGETPGSVRS